jgi:hypothetical protein
MEGRVMLLDRISHSPKSLMSSSSSEPLSLREVGLNTSMSIRIALELIFWTASTIPSILYVAEAKKASGL